MAAINEEGLWVLMPAYNEEKTIKEAITRSKKIVNNILVVNDGSTDSTLRILNELDGVDIINIEKNSGKANALKKGMHHLREKGAKKVITIDADMQHLPEEIPLLIDEFFDIVIGTRQKLNTPMPWIRKFANKMASIIVSAKIGMTIKDPQSGFRLFGQRAINELSFEGSNFNIEKKTLEEAFKKNMKISQVPISCIYGDKLRKSYMGLKDVFEFFKK